MSATTDRTAVIEGYHALVRTDALRLVDAQAGAVLDLGGGIGATSAALKAEGRASRVVLADLVADNPHPLVDVAFSGDLEDPALLDQILGNEGPFDTILCVDVLEHLRDPWMVVARLTGALAPGGAIVTSLPNARNYQLVLPLVLRGRFDLADAGIMDRTHMRWFTRITAIEMMTGSGLRLEAVEDKLLGGRRHVLINRATLGVFRRFLEAQYLMRVRKAV